MTLTKKLASIGFATAAVALGGASIAHAQERIVANVPFSFIVNGDRLPAGHYAVTDDDETGVLQIQSADGHRAVLTTSIPSGELNEQAAAPKLEFEKYSGQYFLSGITYGDGEGRALVLEPSTMDREIAVAGN
jgi:hypothetical protein